MPLYDTTEALPYPSAPCGVVAAVCGRFVAMDTFDSPLKARGDLGRLVASYAIDADTASAQASKSFTAEAAGVLLEHVTDQQCQVFDTVGLGEDLRLEAADALGHVLRVEGHPLHLRVFPPIVNDAHEFGSDLRIQPPSSQKRRP